MRSMFGIEFERVTELDFYKGKRCAVLGATGLIGSYAVMLLKDAGAWVRALANGRDSNEFTMLADVIRRRDLSSLEHAGDAIRDNFDVVVNCAGITGGIGLASHDPVSFVGPATAIAANVLHACHIAKVRCGFLSSTTVYTPRDEPCVEDELGGDNLYPAYRGIGESKRFLEKLCRYYHETVGLEVAVVRPSGAYGRFDNFGDTGHVIPMLINRALSLKPGEPFELWGDGQDVRDVVHAEDIARGYLLAIARAPNADPINLASGVGVTTEQMARTVLDAVGSKAEIAFNPSKPTALKKRLVSIEKARKVLGYEPGVTLEKGIADTVAWRQSCAS